MQQLNHLYDKVESGKAISREEAFWLLTEAELLDIASLATILRQRLNPGRYVTFHIDTNPNYTNICETKCSFCAFYRTPKKEDAYWLSIEQVMEKIAQAVTQGAHTVLLQGGHNSEIPFEYYVRLITETRRRFPQVLPHFFSAPEIQAMSQHFSMPVEEILQAFYAAGQRTLPGGGAEILSQSVRDKISPLKASVGEWLQIHQTAHAIGFKTTATMMYGHLETAADIIDHLWFLRDLQACTHGFYAFIPWSFKPSGNTPLGKKITQVASEATYLRMIGVARLVLNDIPHIQASWFSEGRKTGQLALEFGADDFGGTLIEENVLREANYQNSTTIAEILHMIHDAGYIPVQRDTLYNFMQIYDAPHWFQNRILPPYADFKCAVS